MQKNLLGHETLVREGMLVPLAVNGIGSDCQFVPSNRSAI
jgi:hypothetical protein